VTIPITIDALASFAGGLFLAAVAGLWLKHYLPDWRYTPIFVLGLTLLLVELANWLYYAASFTWQQAGLAAFWALFAATLETWGYEAAVNALGKMGVGKRSDQALQDAAVETLVDRGILALSVVPKELPPEPGTRAI